MADDDDDDEPIARDSRGNALPQGRRLSRNSEPDPGSPSFGASSTHRRGYLLPNNGPLRELHRHDGREPCYGALRFAGVGPWYLFACYCLLNFTLSFGPNVTTFVLPAATYPAETRSTMAGLSSAAGKLGAVLGTELLPVLNQTYSLNVVLVTCVATSLAGAALTAWAVDEICDEEPPPCGRSLIWMAQPRSALSRG